MTGSTAGPHATGPHAPDATPFAVIDPDALVPLVESGGHEWHVRTARRLHLGRRATLLTAIQHQFGDQVSIERAQRRG